MSTAPPVIGLTTYREQAAWGVWSQSADLLPSTYADAVAAAGGVPVLLPPAGDPDTAPAVVARLDALVISGGADVEPARYGAEPHPRTVGWRPDRDAFDLALLAAADEAGLPVLGICRGHQLMAVYAGGTLDQHTPDLVGSNAHSPGVDAFGPIRVSATPGSRLAGLVGNTATVACHHHQSVRDHPGLVPVAYAADGTVEALERPGQRFWLGVQWHPEEGTELGLLRGLVEAARG